MGAKATKSPKTAKKSAKSTRLAQRPAPKRPPRAPRPAAQSPAESGRTAHKIYNKVTASPGKIKGFQLSPGMRMVAYITGLLVLLAVGNLFQNVDLGTVLVIVYGFAALIFRVPSDDTFRLLVANLAYIMLFTLLRNAKLASAFTQYALLLLLFGVLSMLAENFRAVQSSKRKLKISKK